MPNFRGARQTKYGNDHTIARKAAFTVLPEWSTCCRCGQPLWKYTTTRPDRLGRVRSALHYDHSTDRTRYLGFAHKRCNLQAAAVASNGGHTTTVVWAYQQKQSRTW